MTVAIWLSRHVEVGVGNALWIGAAGRIERGGQALAHILHVDIRDGEFAAAHAGALAFVHRTEDAIIVIGVLQEILSGDPIAGGTRVARELQILFKDLVGVAANSQLLPASFVPLPLIMSPAHPVRLAWTPTAGAAVVVII